MLLKSRFISNFSKILKIFTSHGAPPVSITPAANFATSTAGYRWQIMETMSD
jgi:hypothetical protein